MKVKNLMKVGALISAVSLIANPLEVKANQHLDKILEETYEDLENGKKINNGTTIIENANEPKVEKNVLNYLNSLELGDIVEVNGFGLSSSDGTGVKTKEYTNELLAIVAIKENSKYPYALVKINDDGSLSEVVGWFNKEALKARSILTIETDYADIKRTIVNTNSLTSDTKLLASDDVWVANALLPEYAGYKKLSATQAIKLEYVWPEPTKEYDYAFTTKIDDGIQVKEYYDGDKIFYYYYDWDLGTCYSETIGRDKVETNKILSLTK